MGLSEALGFAIGTGCVGYLAAGIVACVFLFLPVLILTYILHRGVRNHAVYVPAEGHFFSRFLDHWREKAEDRKKRFLCIPYGVVMVLWQSVTHANKRGDWEPIEEEEEENDKKQAPVPYWKDPWSKFVKRYGPMFTDFTEHSW
jgi:hypothetical protein